MNPAVPPSPPPARPRCPAPGGRLAPVPASGVAGRVRGWRAAAISLYAILWLADVCAQSPGLRVRGEYEVKAAFIHKLPLFVDWPAGALQPAHGPIRLTVLGRDPFGPWLETVISNKTAGGRRFEIHRTRTVGDALAGGCDILFICDSERDRLPDILNRVAGRPILTVGDTHGYGDRGVMINFFLEDRSVRLEVNRAAGEAAGLRFDSDLSNSRPKGALSPSAAGRALSGTPLPAEGVPAEASAAQQGRAGGRGGGH